MIFHLFGKKSPMSGQTKVRARVPNPPTTMITGMGHSLELAERTLERALETVRSGH